MNRYACLIRTADGELISEEIHAESLNAAFDHLENQGKQVESIQLMTARGELLVIEGESSSAIPANPVDLNLGEETAKLIPVLQAAAAELADSRLRRSLLATTRTLEKKNRLQELLRDRETVHTVPLLLQMRSGQVTTQSLTEWLLERLQHQEWARYKKVTISYPQLLWILAASVFIYFSVVVLPIFDEMFREFDLQVPAVTAKLLAVGRQISEHGLRTGAVMVVVLLSAWAVWRWVGYWATQSESAGYLFMGSNSKLAAMSRFTATLAELLQHSNALPDAIRTASHSCHVVFLERACERMALAAEDVDQWRRSWASEAALPSTLVTTLMTVTSTTAQVEMLRKLSTIYALRRTRRLSIWQDAFPIVAVVVVGGLSGFVVLCLFLPFVSLITSLSG